MVLFNGALELEPTADFHVHLRDGRLMELVVPTIRQGGVDTVYVMREHDQKPNLQPPITTVAAAVSYREQLQRLAPDVTFLMTLYLHPTITRETIIEAVRENISGVKYYPAGVTTNSQDGVLDIAQFYPVFDEMQKQGLVLNLHGEVPSTPASEFSPGANAVTVLNAEPCFLPTLKRLHADFPDLRIVLEHVSTREGLDAVRACGPNVAATITAHHLWMTVDQWCGDAFSFCKPVAKTPADRVALVKAVVERDGKFFFGSDSAPHPLEAKKGSLNNTAAGCFTQGWATQLVIQAVDTGIHNGWIDQNDVTKEILQDFLSNRGRKFYGIDGHKQTTDRQSILVESKGEEIPASIRSKDGSLQVVPFRRKEQIWSLQWRS